MPEVPLWLWLLVVAAAILAGTIAGRDARPRCDRCRHHLTPNEVGSYSLLQRSYTGAVTGAVHLCLSCFLRTFR